MLKKLPQCQTLCQLASWPDADHYILTFFMGVKRDGQKGIQYFAVQNWISVLIQITEPLIKHHPPFSPLSLKPCK